MELVESWQTRLFAILIKSLHRAYSFRNQSILGVLGVLSALVISHLSYLIYRLVKRRKKGYTKLAFSEEEPEFGVDTEEQRMMYSIQDQDDTVAVRVFKKVLPSGKSLDLMNQITWKKDSVHTPVLVDNFCRYCAILVFAVAGSNCCYSSAACAVAFTAVHHYCRQGSHALCHSLEHLNKESRSLEENLP